MIKLSIIIPAYNAENFLSKCLDSCLCQDIIANEYEIIVVDDGSTDRTRQIVDNYQKTYPNIQYIFQENAKQGAARNNGLRHASGKYIWYIDADDWIKENCFASIINKLESNNLEGVAVGHATMCKDKMKVWRQLDETKIVSGKQLLCQGIFLISPTYTIWRKDYLISHQLFYKEQLFHEDTEICPRMYYYADRIGSINEICYFVYQNPNSTTRGVNPKRAFDLVNVNCSISNFRQTINDKRIIVSLDNYISEAINSSLYNIFQFDKKETAKLADIWFLNRRLFRHLCQSKKIKYRLEGYLFTLFPRHVTTLYRLMQYFNSSPGGLKKNNTPPILPNNNYC